MRKGKGFVVVLLSLQPLCSLEDQGFDDSPKVKFVRLYVSAVCHSHRE